MIIFLLPEMPFVFFKSFLLRVKKSYNITYGIVKKQLLKNIEKLFYFMFIIIHVKILE